MDNTLRDLVNAEFSLTWNGNEYLVRKANIRQVLGYQQRMKELRGDPDGDLKLIPWCLRQILGENVSGVTDDQILDGVRGDIIATQDDTLEFLGLLGFMSPEKVEMGKRLQEEARRRTLGHLSSPRSVTEPGGPQTKSGA